MKQTQNYKEFRRIIREANERIDVTSLRNLVEDMEDVLKKHPSNYDAIRQEYGKMVTLLNALKTKKECPRCSALLYLSDLPDYSYVCPTCDENYYEIEIK